MSFEITIIVKGEINLTFDESGKNLIVNGKIESPDELLDTITIHFPWCTKKVGSLNYICSAEPYELGCPLG